MEEVKFFSLNFGEVSSGVKNLSKNEVTYTFGSKFEKFIPTIREVFHDEVDSSVHDALM